MSNVIQRVERREVDDWGFIVGFSHALYGALTPDGKIIAFIGWWQSTYATQAHLATVRGIADEEYRGRPQLDGDTVVVNTASSQVPEVLPPSMYEFATHETAAAHGVVA
ncbi:hypothetical protein HUG10_21455 (plasmid) [Halorarum halophilum]|uniref:Uncharacterized protein n=1 Tax=Halorarum halophilum TaxID=2743090 RepID=A0A7D5KGW6_9EURY|nr:hypothetical protein [Halobaculum halophilum]QLG30157.1 hypothetical protein HUG10_21455 [Halobaculum halophilum]